MAILPRLNKLCFFGRTKWFDLRINHILVEINGSLGTLGRDPAYYSI